MKRKLSTVLFALLVFSLPVFAVFNSEDLGVTLHNLRIQLQQEYRKISVSRNRMAGEYNEQHRRMINIIKECNELSLVLYSQRQNYTFDLSYALQKVTQEYNDFNRDRLPYDRIATSLDQEIDRYARLLEALRRLPPERKAIEEVPDSLVYHNDSLERHLLQSGASLTDEIERVALHDTAVAPFILDGQGEQDRDSCIFYASQMLKMCAERKAILVADSIHYQEAHLRLKESYDYARDRYKVLQQRIFVDGQTPWGRILSNPGRYWKRAVEEARDKYDFSLLEGTEAPQEAEGKFTVGGKQDYTFQILLVGIQLVSFFFFWALSILLVWLLCKYVKPLSRVVAKQQKPFLSMLLAVVLFLLLMGGNGPDSIASEALGLASTFMWLLGAILVALLVRMKPSHLTTAFRLYLPTILLALTVIGCRVLFVPNSLMNFLFPPVLLVFVVWLLAVCLRFGKRVERGDRIISWVSFVVTAAAFGLSVAGYIFLALLVLVWWYFQMAVIQILAAVWHLSVWYGERRLDHRIREVKSQDMGGLGQRENFLFRVTWFYDLVRTVIIPVAALLSIPFCLRLALDVFDFTDLYENLYNHPFINLSGADGGSTLRISFRSLVVIFCLYFVFRYLNHAIRSVYVQARYSAFLRAHKRTSVRNNEINFSLGNSIISVLVWLVFAIVVVRMLRIPTGWITVVAGGLSAGIGLALKDIINNFIYGIQLMSGRLRVGDWIECDGIRGTVTKISYQSTQIETVEGAQMSFLNASLFGKNFSNLTRNNSYEFLKIIVGVAYGTDVQRVREVLVEAMQVLRTKDAYGREIVRPDKGIYVVFNDFGDSSVDVAVKQYVLVSERIGYVDRAKEVIYDALNKAGIEIPFPQRDIHIREDKSQE